MDLRDLLVLAGDFGLAAEAVLAGLFFLAGLRPRDLQIGKKIFKVYIQNFSVLMSSIPRQNPLAPPQRNA